MHPLSRENIAAGQKTNFSCEAFGIPRPVITWFKDNQRVLKSRVKEIKAKSVLTVDSVTPQDQGRYWCEANSDEGWNRIGKKKNRIVNKRITRSSITCALIALFLANSKTYRKHY